MLNRKSGVSVIMPVYNGERFVKQAIESILSQTYDTFELIIINDGSTDRTNEVIESISDDRIRYFSRENKGLSITLIELMELSKYEYVARMDADDVAKRERLAEQVQVLDSNINTVLVGTNVEYIDDEGRVLGVSVSLTKPNLIRKKLYKSNMIYHPSVMFRKQIYTQIGGYSPIVNKYCEDYLLWLEFLKVGDIEVTKSILLSYRVHNDSISSNSPVLLDWFTKNLRSNRGSYPLMSKDFKRMCSSGVERHIVRERGHRLPKLILPVCIFFKELIFYFK